MAGHYTGFPLPDGSVVVDAGRSLTVCGALSGLNCYVLEAGAKLDLCLLAFPGAESAEIVIDLAGEGAEASLSGIYVCREGEYSLKVTVHHRVGGCRSEQLFKGIENVELGTVKCVCSPSISTNRP